MVWLRWGRNEEYEPIREAAMLTNSTPTQLAIRCEWMLESLAHDEGAPPYLTRLVPTASAAGVHRLCATLERELA